MDSTCSEFGKVRTIASILPNANMNIDFWQTTWVSYPDMRTYSFYNPNFIIELTELGCIMKWKEE